MANSTTNLDLLSPNQGSKEVTGNALWDSMSPSSLFGRRSSTTSALTWGYYGGNILLNNVITIINNGTLNLVNNIDNYIEINNTNGSILINNVGFSNSGTTKLYKVTTLNNFVNSYTDYRAFLKLSGSDSYVLPKASTTTLGGVIVDGITITIDANGKISSSYSYTLPKASTTSLGGVIVDGTTITIDANGKISSVGGGGGASITVKDEGNVLTNAVNSLNFVGSGVTLSGTNDITISIPGGGTGGGGFNVGSNVARACSFKNPTSNTGWAGYTITTLLDSANIVNICNSFIVNFYISSTSTSCNIGGIAIKRTLPNSRAVIDTTSIRIGGSLTPVVTLTPNTQTIISSDLVALNIDVNHDYYLYIYFTNDSINNSTLLAQENAPTGDLKSNFIQLNLLSETTVSTTSFQFGFVVKNIVVKS